MPELIFSEETFAIRGACFEVYKEKGSGFHEAVYQECLEIEFALRGIPFVAKPRLKLEYKGHPLTNEYVPDFIAHDQIIIELKALSTLVDEHRGQVHNYLRAAGMRLGLLVNFGHHPQIEIERIVR